MPLRAAYRVFSSSSPSRSSAVHISATSHARSMHRALRLFPTFLRLRSIPLPRHLSCQSLHSGALPQTLCLRSQPRSMRSHLRRNFPSLHSDRFRVANLHFLHFWQLYHTAFSVCFSLLIDLVPFTLCSVACPFPFHSSPSRPARVSFHP